MHSYSVICSTIILKILAKVMQMHRMNLISSLKREIISSKQNLALKAISSCCTLCTYDMSKRMKENKSVPIYFICYLVCF